MAFKSRITKVSDNSSYPVLILRHGSMSVPQRKTSVQEISRPGISGHDYQQFAEKAPLFQVNCELDEISESTALEVKNWFESLQGNLIDYQDEYSRVWPDVMVVTVGAQIEFRPSLGFRYPKYDPLNPIGTSQFQISVSFNLRVTTEPEGL